MTSHRVASSAVTHHREPTDARTCLGGRSSGDVDPLPLLPRGTASTA